MSRMTFTSQSTPVEIDTEIARLSLEMQRPLSEIQRQCGLRDNDSAYYRCLHDADKLAEAEAEHDKLRSERRAMVDLYTGWPRYYHVTNANGHIHTSMGCSSCFHDTLFSWRTDLSGLTEEEVVAREAYNACTVCMPIAPAEQKAARQHYNAERREAKRIEKEAWRLEKLRNQALRAIKFLAKVDAQVIASFGSWDTVWAEYSLHGKDGKKSLYTASYELPTQVANYLYDEMDARHPGGRSMRHFTDPKVIIAEARAEGLIPNGEAA